MFSLEAAARFSEGGVNGGRPEQERGVNRGRGDPRHERFLKRPQGEHHLEKQLSPKDHGLTVACCQIRRHCGERSAAAQENISRTGSHPQQAAHQLHYDTDAAMVRGDELLGQGSRREVLFF